VFLENPAAGLNPGASTAQENIVVKLKLTRRAYGIYLNAIYYLTPWPVI